MGASEAAVSSLSVIVPTYRRPVDLLRCLKALSQQEQPALEVLVVVRVGDDATLQALGNSDAAHSLSLTIITVEEGGVVAALNAGLAQARGDIVCFTDDDAAPRPDWLRRISDHFRRDPAAAGVGGRDIIHRRTGILSGSARTVGVLTWYGNAKGNHHLGIGPARYVDILKGVNMSFRRDALEGLQFDRNLKGSGAQVHNEMALCLALRRRNLKLIYDPLLLVDHYPAERFDEDIRDQSPSIGISNAAFNLRKILISHYSPSRMLAVRLWYLLVGTRPEPGCARLLHAAMRRDFDAFRRWRAARIGVLEAERAHRYTNREAR